MTPNDTPLPKMKLEGILEHGSRDECLGALRELRNLDEKDINSPLIDLLIRSLGHRFWLIRREISNTLVRLGEPVVDHLIPWTTSDDDDICYWSLKTLSLFPARAMPHIESLLHHEQADIRFNCVQVLGNIHSDRSITLLIEKLSDTDRHVRERAAASLRTIGRPAGPSLVEAFKSRNPDTRFWSMRVLGQILKSEAFPILSVLLKSSDPQTRYYALTALGELDSDEAGAAIVRGLADDAWIVRRQAGEMIEAKGHQAERYLHEAFVEGDPALKYWTIKLLGRVMGPRAIPYLNMIRTTADEETRYLAVTALGEIRHPESVKSLIEAFTDESWAVRRHAADELEMMPDLAFDPLVEALQSENSEIHYWAIRTLVWMGPRGILPLKPLLQSGHKREKQFIISQLPMVEEPAVDLLDILINCLDDKDWPVREKAALYLEREGEKTVAALEEALNWGNENINYWATKILIAIQARICGGEEESLAEKPLPAGEAPDEEAGLAPREKPGLPNAAIGKIGMLIDAASATLETGIEQAEEAQQDSEAGIEVPSLTGDVNMNNPQELALYLEMMLASGTHEKIMKLVPLLGFDNPEISLRTALAIKKYHHQVEGKAAKDNMRVTSDER